MPSIHAQPSRALNRRWRRQRGRGVAEIVAIIMMVVIVVVLAAVLFVLIRGYTAGGATAPGLGTAFAVGTPQDGVGLTGIIAGCSTTACNFYNLSVQEADRPLELHDIAMEIIGQNGSSYLPPGGLVVVNATNAIVGTTTFGGGVWTTGGTVPVTSTLTFVVYTSGANPASLTGDTLRFFGESAYSGTIDVHVF